MHRVRTHNSSMAIASKYKRRAQLNTNGASDRVCHLLHLERNQDLLVPPPFALLCSSGEQQSNVVYIRK